MAKTRGLPSSFQLEVPRESLMRPVQLGEYLDDDIGPAPVPRERPASPAVTSAPERSMPTRVAAVPARKVLPMRGEGTPSPLAQAEALEETEEPVTISRPPGKNPPRKQVNMNPETLRMVDDLLDQIQDYSGQKDAKVSEMFHALVSALYEARELLDFSEVQSRGKWGSPTARAFPVSLKNAFRRAIAEWESRNA